MLVCVLNMSCCVCVSTCVYFCFFGQVCAQQKARWEKLKCILMFCPQDLDFHLCVNACWWSFLPQHGWIDLLHCWPTGYNTQHAIESQRHMKHRNTSLYRSAFLCFHANLWAWTLFIHLFIAYVIWRTGKHSQFPTDTSQSWVEPL